MTERHQGAKLEAARAVGAADITKGVGNVSRAGESDPTVLNLGREVLSGMRVSERNVSSDPIVDPEPEAWQLEYNISTKYLGGERKG